MKRITAYIGRARAEGRRPHLHLRYITFPHFVYSMPDLPPMRDSSNSPTGLRPHEFFLIRYVPDVVRGEFINIGVVVREVRTVNRPQKREARVQIAPDYGRLSRMFSDVDFNFINGMRDMFELWTSEGVSADSDVNVFDKITEQLSLTIQLTDPQGCLTEDIDKELELLMRMYVDPQYEGRSISPRSQLFKTLSDGLLPVQEGVTAETYTARGDTLELDYMYRTATATHVIQAICIDEGIEAALAFAKRAETLRRNYLEIEGTPLEIMVVTELPPKQVASGQVQGDADAFDTYHFAVAQLRAAGIEVKTVAEAATIAERVKRTAI